MASKIQPLKPIQIVLLEAPPVEKSLDLYGLQWENPEL